MKAFGFKQAGGTEVLEEFDADIPEIGPHDIMVEVKGVSLNPVDIKVRNNLPPETGFKTLGYDAAGIIKEVGSQTSKFKVGDEVFYSGDLTRAGTNAEFHVVDERIVGKKPKKLGFAEAAGMPLTTITAWEILFDCLHLTENDGEGESILVIGGAGGVGSILIQLAKQLTKLNVIATASRPETIDWVLKMGADHVINHREPLAKQVENLGVQPKYVAALTGTDGHFGDILELVKPRGHIAFIDDPATLDIKAGKQKALSFSWEFMFTRSMFGMEDIEKQHELLTRVSEMLDDGSLVSTVSNNLGQLSLETLVKAHKLQETGTVIGKNVLEVL